MTPENMKILLPLLLKLEENGEKIDQINRQLEAELEQQIVAEDENIRDSDRDK